MECAVATSFVQPSAGVNNTELDVDGPSRPNQNWKGIWKPVAALIFGAGLIVGGLVASGVIAVLSFGILSPVSLWLGVLAINAGVVAMSWAIKDLGERAGNSDSEPSLADSAPFARSSNDVTMMQYEGRFDGKRFAEDRRILMAIYVEKKLNFTSRRDERIDKLVEYYSRLSIKPGIKTFFGKMPDNEIADLSDLLFQAGISEKLSREPDALAGLSGNAIAQLRRTSPCRLFLEGRLTSAQLKKMDKYYGSIWQSIYPALSTENCMRVANGEITIDTLIAQDPNLN